MSKLPGHSSFLPDFDIESNLNHYPLYLWIDIENYSEEMVERYMEYYKNYINLFDGVIVHDKNMLVRKITDKLRNDTKLIFMPHTNVFSNDRQKSWEKMIDKINKNSIDIIVGSKRTSELFTGHNDTNVNVYIGPTSGVPYDKIDYDFVRDKQHIENIKYDIYTYGSIHPGKGVHKTIELANKLSQKRKEKIRVCIVGPESDAISKKYWEKICKPMINQNVNVDYKKRVNYKKLIELLTKSKTVFLPSTHLKETFYACVWEALSIRNDVVGADWAGGGDAMHTYGGYPIPVEKVDQQIIDETVSRDTISIKYVQENDGNITGYEINMKKSISIIDKLLDRNKEEIKIKQSIPGFAQLTNFEDTIVKILNEKPPYKVNTDSNNNKRKNFDCLKTHIE